MEITRFTFNPFQELTYVLWDKKSLQCAIIDPGCLTGDEQETLARFISDNRLSVKHLLLTHLHIDHYYGAPFVARTYHVGVEANAAEKPLLDMMQQQAIAFGTPPPADILPITRYLADGDTLYIGDEPLQVIGAAGHSPGGIAFYAPESGFVCSGDSLFRQFRATHRVTAQGNMHPAARDRSISRPRSRDHHRRRAAPQPLPVTKSETHSITIVKARLQQIPHLVTASQCFCAICRPSCAAAIRYTSILSPTTPRRQISPKVSFAWLRQAKVAAPTSHGHRYHTPP